MLARPWVDTNGTRYIPTYPPTEVDRIRRRSYHKHLHPQRPVPALSGQRMHKREQVQFVSLPGTSMPPDIARRWGRRPQGLI